MSKLFSSIELQPVPAPHDLLDLGDELGARRARVGHDRDHQEARDQSRGTAAADTACRRS